MTKIQLTTQALQAIEPQEVVQQLTESQYEIVLANQGKRIIQMSNNELTKLAGEVIFTAKTRLGYNQSQGDDLKAEIRLIASDLRGFNGLTANEVHLALKAGVNGEFSTEGKVFFSSSSFVQWLRKWIADKKRPVMKQYTALEQAKESVKPPPTEAEQKVLSMRLAEHYAVSKLHNPDFVVPVAFSLYDDLERFDIWKMEKEDKIALFESLMLEYKNATNEELVIRAKNIAYNKYIEILALGFKR